MENLTFDLPHTIYINILRNLKGLGGLDNIYYTTLINTMLRDQGVYHVFNKIDEDSKHTLINKGLVVAKQQKFRKTKLKPMKVALEQSHKEDLLVDLDTINKRKLKRLAKTIADENQGLNSFSISKKIRRFWLSNRRDKRQGSNPKMKKRRKSYLPGNIGQRKDIIYLLHPPLCVQQLQPQSHKG